MVRLLTLRGGRLLILLGTYFGGGRHVVLAGENGIITTIKVGPTATRHVFMLTVLARIGLRDHLFLHPRMHQDLNSNLLLPDIRPKPTFQDSCLRRRCSSHRLVHILNLGCHLPMQTY